MTTFTQKAKLSDVLKAEFAANFNREVLTIASGAGDLAVGTVLGKVTASGKYVPADPDNVDGSQTAAGVLLQAVDATAADIKAAVLVRGPAVVAKDALAYAGTNDAADITALEADLVGLGIVVRDAV